MHFSDSFFKGEERCGFFVSSFMKRCWAAQIEVLLSFDSICQAHGIRYFAAYGTLLGAVRHKGFIPCDDDLDIWVFRKDMDKLIMLGREEYEAYGLELATPYSDVEYRNLTFRLINTRVTRLDEDFLLKYHGFPHMAGLDLFPLDNVPDKEEDLKFTETLLASANVLAQIWKNDEVPLEEKMSAYDVLAETLHLQPAKDTTIENQLWQLSDRMCAMFNEEDTEYVAAYTYMFADRRKKFKKISFNDTLYLDFESIKLPVPAGYEDVLLAEFGDDYMTPKQLFDEHEYPYYRSWQDKLMKYFEANGIKCPDMFKE